MDPGFAAVDIDRRDPALSGSDDAGAATLRLEMKVNGLIAFVIVDIRGDDRRLSLRHRLHRRECGLARMAGEKARGALDRREIVDVPFGDRVDVIGRVGAVAGTFGHLLCGAPVEHQIPRMIAIMDGLARGEGRVLLVGKAREDDAFKIGGADTGQDVFRSPGTGTYSSQ
ncbi:hypothetical protein WI697_11135 [Tistrella mobilis]